MPELSARVMEFTDSVIRRMTRISNQYGAINLSQGFPDFDPPKEILDELARVAYDGPGLRYSMRTAMWRAPFPSGRGWHRWRRFCGKKGMTFFRMPGS